MIDRYPSHVIIHQWSIKDETKVIDEIRKAVFADKPINCKIVEGRVSPIKDIYGYPYGSAYIFKCGSDSFCTIHKNKEMLLIAANYKPKRNNKLYNAVKLAFFDTFKIVKTN